MKVVIHFGHHKVGSTALQAFLSRNHRRLLDRGILYPAVESEGLCHALAGALKKGDAAGLNDINIREPHNALAFRMLGQTPAWHGDLPAVAQMIRTLRLQVRYLKPHTVLLCSEVMSHFGPHPQNLIARLKAIFPDAEYELYCVLRRPDDYLVSWHGQRLRFGHRVPALRDGIAPYADTIHFDYHKLLAPWVAQFPQAPIHVRPYGDILKAGGSVQDFMATTSVAFPRRLTRPGQANASFPRAAMEIIRRGNRDLERPAAQALRGYFMSPTNGLKPAPNSDVEMFGAAHRAEMAALFAPIHDYLCALTGSDFFPDIDRVTQCRPIPETEAMSDLLAQIDPATLADADARDFIRRLQHAPAA